MQKISGSAAFNSRVLIRIQHGDDAVLYADAAGSVVVSNPIVVPTSGVWSAYVRDGIYAVTTIVDGQPAQTKTLVLVSGDTSGKSSPPVVVIAQQHTQSIAPADTNENTLWSATLPAGLMGPNDALRVSFLVSHTSGANNKTWKIALGGTAIVNATMTTTTALRGQAQVVNRNSQSSQVFAAPTSAGAYVPGQTTAAALSTATINMAQAQILAITAQKASAGDAMVLESVVVELIPAAS